MIGYGLGGFLLSFVLSGLPFIGPFISKQLLQSTLWFIEHWNLSRDSADGLTQLMITIAITAAAISAGKEAVEEKDKAIASNTVNGVTNETATSAGNEQISANQTIEMAPAIMQNHNQQVIANPTSNTGSFRLVIYRIMQVLMIGWTLLCAFLGFSGIASNASDLSSDLSSSDSAVATGTAIGAGVAMFIIFVVWLVVLIGLAIVTYFVRPRAKQAVQVIYVNTQPVTTSNTPPQV
jgi:uncharacterized membrane protein YtjA (UPF0391 family)